MNTRKILGYAFCFIMWVGLFVFLIWNLGPADCSAQYPC